MGLDDCVRDILIYDSTGVLGGRRERKLLRWTLKNAAVVYRESTLTEEAEVCKQARFALKFINKELNGVTTDCIMWSRKPLRGMNTEAPM